MAAGPSASVGPPPDATARSLASPLLAVVVGAVLVVIDLDLGGITFLPDPVGWAVIAVGAARVRAPRLREGDHQLAGRRRVGSALLGLAVVSAVDGVLELAGVRSAAEVASRPLASWDAVLLTATVVVAVAFLRTMAAFAADLSLTEAADRLRRSSILVGVAWGLVAVGLSTAAALFDPGGVDVELGGGGGLLLAIGVLAMFAILAHAGWALLRLRGELLRGARR